MRPNTALLLGPIGPWYRSAAGACGPALAVSATDAVDQFVLFEPSKTPVNCSSCSALLPDALV